MDFLFPFKHGNIAPPIPGQIKISVLFSLDIQYADSVANTSISVYADKLLVHTKTGK